MAYYGLPQHIADDDPMTSSGAKDHSDLHNAVDAALEDARGAAKAADVKAQDAQDRVKVLEGKTFVPKPSGGSPGQVLKLNSAGDPDWMNDTTVPDVRGLPSSSSANTGDVVTLAGGSAVWAPVPAGRKGDDGAPGTNGVVSSILGPAGGDHTAPAIQFTGPGVTVTGDMSSGVAVVDIEASGTGLPDMTGVATGSFLEVVSAGKAGWVTPASSGSSATMNGGDLAKYLFWQNRGEYRGPSVLGASGPASGLLSLLGGPTCWQVGVKFVVYETHSFDMIAFEGPAISTADLNTLYRMGVYASNGQGQPDALLVDSGPVPYGTGGLIGVSISLKLDPGRYWLAMRGTPNKTTNGPWALRGPVQVGGYSTGYNQPNYNNHAAQFLYPNDNPGGFGAADRPLEPLWASAIGTAVSGDPYGGKWAGGAVDPYPQMYLRRA